MNASDESQSIRAFDKKTGQEVWKVEGIGPHPSYGTPTLVPRKDQSADLVLAISGEVRGFHPESGKPHWFAKTNLAGSVCASVVSDGQTLFVYGGADGRGSLALRAGGEGDVSKSHMLWRSRNASYVATPVLYDKHLYWLDDEGRACSSLPNRANLSIASEWPESPSWMMEPMPRRSPLREESTSRPAMTESSSWLPSRNTNCWRTIGFPKTGENSTQRQPSEQSTVLPFESLFVLRGEQKTVMPRGVNLGDRSMAEPNSSKEFRIETRPRSSAPPRRRNWWIPAIVAATTVIVLLLGIIVFRPVNDDYTAVGASQAEPKP